MTNTQRALLVNFAGAPITTAAAHHIVDNSDTVIYLASTSSALDTAFDLAAKADGQIRFDLLYRESTLNEAFAETAPAVLDSGDLGALAEGFLYFARTLDRVFLSPLSHRQSERYFNALASYWSAYLRDNRIDVVAFPVSPHFPPDLSLFFVAKHLGIQTIVCHPTALDDCIQIADDFRAAHATPYDFGEAPFNVPRARLEAAASQLPRRSQGWRDSNENLLRRGERVPSPGLWLTKFALVSVGQRIRKASDRMISRRGAVSSSQGITVPYATFWHHMSYRYRWFKEMATVRDFLELNAVAPNLDSDYIYYPLHLQAERTTDPEGGFYSYQELAIRLLAAAKPRNWRVYVKEHPQQLTPTPVVRRFHYRDIAFYERIASIPDVSFVPVIWPQDDMIRNARVVASCTGTSVWESLLEGVPSVSFGHTWHKRCDSSPVVAGIEDLERQLRRLAKKTPEDVRSDVGNFLEEHWATLVSVSYDVLGAKNSSMPVAAHGQNLGKALVAAMHRGPASSFDLSSRHALYSGRNPSRGGYTTPDRSRPTET